MLETFLDVPTNKQNDNTNRFKNDVTGENFKERLQKKITATGTAQVSR